MAAAAAIINIVTRVVRCSYVKLSTMSKTRSQLPQGVSGSDPASSLNVDQLLAIIKHGVQVEIDNKLGEITEAIKGNFREIRDLKKRESERDEREKQLIRKVDELMQQVQELKLGQQHTATADTTGKDVLESQLSAEEQIAEVQRRHNNEKARIICIGGNNGKTAEQVKSYIESISSIKPIKIILIPSKQQDSQRAKVIFNSSKDAQQAYPPQRLKELRSTKTYVDYALTPAQLQRRRGVIQPLCSLLRSSNTHGASYQGNSLFVWPLGQYNKRVTVNTSSFTPSNIPKNIGDERIKRLLPAVSPSTQPPSLPTYASAASAGTTRSEPNPSEPSVPSSNNSGVDRQQTGDRMSED